MDCPRCGSINHRKDGIVGGRQRHYVTRHNIKRKEFFIAAGACNDNGFPLGPNSDPNDARHFYKVIVVSVHINFTFFLRQLCLKGVLIVGDNLFRQIEKILFKLEPHVKTPVVNFSVNGRR